jgi:hypothetical protein
LALGGAGLRARPAFELVCQLLVAAVSVFLGGFKSLFYKKDRQCHRHMVIIRYEKYTNWLHTPC